MGAEQEPRGLFIAVSISMFKTLVDHAKKTACIRETGASCGFRWKQILAGQFGSQTSVRAFPRRELSRQQNEERVLERN